VYMFKLFGPSGCALHQFLISFTIVTTLAYTLISLFLTDRGGILPSATVALYCHFLCFSALSSDAPSSDDASDLQCYSQFGNSVGFTIIGLALGAVSISYAAWNLANPNSLFGPSGEEPENKSSSYGSQNRPNSSLLKDEHSSQAKEGSDNADKLERATSDKSDKSDKSEMTVADALDARDEDREAVVGSSTRYSKFHFVMACSAMYMAMVLTNWSSRSEAQNGSSANLGKENLWIKTVTQWVTTFLYTWTLVAPLLFPNRDFS